MNKKKLIFSGMLTMFTFFFASSLVTGNLPNNGFQVQNNKGQFTKKLNYINKEIVLTNNNEVLGEKILINSNNLNKEDYSIEKKFEINLKDYYWIEKLQNNIITVDLNFNTILNTKNENNVSYKKDEIINSLIFYVNLKDQNTWVGKIIGNKEASISKGDTFSKATPEFEYSYNEKTKSISCSFKTKIIKKNYDNSNVDSLGKVQGITNLKNINLKLPYSRENSLNKIIENVKTINLFYTSNTSPSIFEEKNISDLKNKLEEEMYGGDKPLIPRYLFESLGGRYNFRQEIENWIDFKFSNYSNTTSIKFNFNVSEDIRRSPFFERIFFNYGMVIDNDGKKMVKDKVDVLEAGEGEQNKFNNGKVRIHSPLEISYYEFKKNTNDNNVDYVYVDGAGVKGLNSFYNINLYDKKEFNNDENNEYVVNISHKKNSLIVGDKDIEYTITIIVDSVIEPVNITKMNWNPSSDEAKQLTEEFIDIDGKKIENPNYDPEIDRNTGLKKQIVWVKNKLDIGNFALDTLNEKGNVITDDEYDYGFIAEANIANYGSWTKWDSDKLNKVQRRITNYKLEDSYNESSTVDLQKDSNNLQTDNNIYYISYDQGENVKISGQKILYIDGNENTNEKFTDFINSEYAENFWLTIHGYHLKQYIKENRNKKITEKELNQLNYEQITSIWNDYILNLKNGKFSPLILGPDVYLENIKINDIKIEQKDDKQQVINKIVDEINKSILDENLGLDINNVKLDEDYKLYYKNKKGLFREIDDKFYEYITKENQYNIEIYAKSTVGSEKIIGKTNTFKIFNGKQNDLEKINPLRLGSLKFSDLEYNFKTIDEDIFKKYVETILPTYFINSYISNGINSALNKQELKINISQEDDYNIYFNYGTKNQINFDEKDKVIQQLKEFVSDENGEITVTIIADKKSKKIYGINQYKIINSQFSKTPGEGIPPGSESDFVTNGPEEFDLSSIDIPEIKYNFSNLKLDEFINNYIYGYIERIFESKNMKLINDYNYQITLNGLKKESFSPLLKNHKKRIEDFLLLGLEQSEMNTLTITINGLNNNSGIDLINDFKIKIVNDLDAESAPSLPRIPTNKEDKSNSKLLVIIISIILGLLIIGLITFLLVKRFKKSKLY